MRSTKIVAALALVFAVACGNDDGAGVKNDAGVADAPDTTPDASCFENPQTHEEIINACTSAQKIFKDSHPPLLEPDGSLPPLPQ